MENRFPSGRVEVEGGFDGFGERARVMGIEEETGLSVLDDFSVFRNIAAEDESSFAERLHDGNGHAFRERREDEEVEMREEAGGVGKVSKKFGLVG